MTMPIATYRLQLRNGFTFGDAAKIVPYLAKLGISHVYLSPIFRAPASSTHGYDALDFSEIDPSLGGSAGFDALIDELKRFSLKAIVDFVPNHMAASPDNPWWRDVLEWGDRSRYAHHFDIDWSAPKLLVPILGKQYWDVLSSGELKIALDEERGELVGQYFDNALPLNPAVYPAVFASSPDAELANFGKAAAATAPEQSAQLKADFKQLLSSKGDAIQESLANLNKRVSDVHALLERQAWRLAYWRTAREMLTYRRFFEISDLVGVRVEQPDVFADVHRSVLDLVAEGKIDGLRIDHIDGLADPQGYLKRLRSATSAHPDLYLVAENILGPDEDVRADWPIDGTTGYEFIRDLSAVFVSGDLECLSKGYDEFTAAAHDFAAETLAVKRRTLTFNLAAELRGLVTMAVAIADADVATRDFGPDALRAAIIEIAAHFAVYRTYVNQQRIAETDLNVINAVSDRAKASRDIEDPATIDFILSIIVGDVSPSLKPQALAFVTRFQQTTGPLMAKAVEDTEFYRFNRLIALNEVGGEPEHPHRGVEVFHDAMKKRQALAPRALSATSTHDTKRGEDARVRLYGIARVQEDWCSAVDRWQSQLRASANLAGEIDSETQWLFFQALAGAWPIDSRGDLSDDFVARIDAFMLKAAREAKLRTSWTNPDAAYEKRISSFVGAALKRETAFLDDFKRTIEPLVAAGAAASLVQTVVKILAPGIPDIYQGTELWDLSLVDPDNRRHVDYDQREQFEKRDLKAGPYGQNDWRDGRIKLDILKKSLAVRRGMNFISAEYIPLTIEGADGRDCLAFMRRSKGEVAIVIGAIPDAAAYQGASTFGFDGASLGEAAIALPRDVQQRSFAEVFSGRKFSVEDGRMKASEILPYLPVAVLLPTK